MTRSRRTTREAGPSPDRCTVLTRGQTSSLGAAVPILLALGCRLFLAFLGMRPTEPLEH